MIPTAVAPPCASARISLASTPVAIAIGESWLGYLDVSHRRRSGSAEGRPASATLGRGSGTPSNDKVRNPAEAMMLLVRESVGRVGAGIGYTVERQVPEPGRDDDVVGPEVHVGDLILRPERARAVIRVPDETDRPQLGIGRGSGEVALVETGPGSPHPRHQREIRLR